MSQDASSTVKRAYEAFRKGDILGVATLLDANVAWSFPDAQGLWFDGTHRGPAQIVEGVFGGIGTHMSEFRLEPESFIDVGDRVAVTGRVRATAKTGRALDAPYFQVWRVLGGKAVQVTEYHDRSAWLSALAGG
jgi:uncharacterized protein